MRQVLMYPGEDGYWVVECPSLPGCISQGESREEAITNIRDAIGEYIKSLEDDGMPAPDINDLLYPRNYGPTHEAYQPNVRPS